jgi:Tfp pilus assembly major pilin PilA
MFYQKQKGLFFAEIMASIAIISTLTISAFSFYNYAVTNAQVITALRPAQAVMTQVQTRFAHGLLPCNENDNEAVGIFKFNGSKMQGYVQDVTWYPNCTSDTRQGHLAIAFKEDDNINQLLAGKHIVFFFKQSQYGGSLLYQACLTNISGVTAPTNNQLPEEGSESIHLISCQYAQELNPVLGTPNPKTILPSGANEDDATTSFAQPAQE